MGFLPSGSEWIIILIIVVIIFGGSRLPGLFKALGQGVKEFRDASKDDSSDAKKEPEKLDASPEQPQGKDKPAA
jgi:sec-independent protein translocase protein TatA